MAGGQVVLEQRRSACGMAIRKMAPRNAPCTEPRPPITIISSRSMRLQQMLNWSGEMNCSLCAYRAPAMPGQRGRQRKRQRLVVRQVDAHALRRDLGIPNGHERAPGRASAAGSECPACTHTVTTRHSEVELSRRCRASSRRCIGCLTVHAGIAAGNRLPARQHLFDDEAKRQRGHAQVDALDPQAPASPTTSPTAADRPAAQAMAIGNGTPMWVSTACV